MDHGQESNPLLDLDTHLVIAHRGASGEAPENTLPAFALALQQGAHALELDVRATADGQIIVLHDPVLNRTTDRAGVVSELPLARIREADAGAAFSSDQSRSFPFRGRGIRIPTLAEVLDQCPGVPLLVDLKDRADQEVLAAMLLRHQAQHQCVVASEDDGALERFRTPPFLAGASARDIARLYFSPFLGAAREPGRYRLLSVPVRHRGLPIPTRRFLRAARRRGCPVHVWTVDDPAVALRLWRRGAAGMVTNYPARLRQALRQLGTGSPTDPHRRDRRDV